jgi:hypothetical protein
MLGLRNLVSASLRLFKSKKEVVCIDELLNKFSGTQTIFDIKERRA